MQKLQKRPIVSRYVAFETADFYPHITHWPGGIGNLAFIAFLHEKMEARNEKISPMEYKLLWHLSASVS